MAGLPGVPSGPRIMQPEPSSTHLRQSTLASHQNLVKWWKGVIPTLELRTFNRRRIQRL